MPLTNDQRTPETISPKDRQAWRAWLSKNHASSSRVWVMVPKKGSGDSGFSLDDVVEEALCFGWIDSRLNVVDEKRYKLLVTPRKRGSIWSKSNKQRVEELTRRGLMTEAGLAKVETAKRDGSWDRLSAIENLEVPEDFDKALAANRDAKSNFEAFSESFRKQLLWWIESAKTQATRQKRINTAVAMAAENRKTLPSS